MPHVILHQCIFAAHKIHKDPFRNAPSLSRHSCSTRRLTAPEHLSICRGRLVGTEFLTIPNINCQIVKEKDKLVPLQQREDLILMQSNLIEFASHLLLISRQSTRGNSRTIEIAEGRNGLLKTEGAAI